MYPFGDHQPTRTKALAASRAVINGNLLRARSAVTPDTPCTTCREPMDDEFPLGYDDELFDGVLNDAGEPFHHGCEDF